jgi:uroporphyrinogen-III synthase
VTAAGPISRTELAGKRIAICRPPDEAEPLAQLLLPLGATVLAIPLIRIDPSEDPEPLKRAASHLDQYDWVVVTSAHAARALAGARPKAPWPESVKVAVVGEGTAQALAELGVPVSIIPAEPSGIGLATALAARIGPELAGQRILFPRSNLARRALPDGLRAAGATVDEVEAYVTRADPTQADHLVAELRDSKLDGVVVTSPSTAEALMAAAARAGDGRELLARTRLVSIGPTTSARLAELGRPADGEAERPDPPGILAAIRAVLG